MLDIVRTLIDLSVKRPIFHSEADFQHALAWEIHQKWPECSMRLEFKAPHAINRMHIDIWAIISDITIAIELKYKTKAFHTNIQQENFDLSNHSAPDQGRYDFLKDIQKLEQVVDKKQNAVGYAIFLSNDSTYWKQPASASSTDEQFRIHQYRNLTGELKWRMGASKGSTKGRENSIIIKDSYILNWQDYSNLDGSPQTNGKFRSLSVRVDRKMTT